MQQQPTIPSVKPEFVPGSPERSKTSFDGSTVGSPVLFESALRSGSVFRSSDDVLALTVRQLLIDGCDPEKLEHRNADLTIAAAAFSARAHRAVGSTTLAAQRLTTIAIQPAWSLLKKSVIAFRRRNGGGYLGDVEGITLALFKRITDKHDFVYIPSPNIPLLLAQYLSFSESTPFLREYRDEGFINSALGLGRHSNSGVTTTDITMVSLENFGGDNGEEDEPSDFFLHNADPREAYYDSVREDTQSLVARVLSETCFPPAVVTMFEDFLSADAARCENAVLAQHLASRAAIIIGALTRSSNLKGAQKTYAKAILSASEKIYDALDDGDDLAALAPIAVLEQTTHNLLFSMSIDDPGCTVLGGHSVYVQLARSIYAEMIDDRDLAVPAIAAFLALHVARITSV